MTVGDVLNVAAARCVRLVVVDDQLRAQGRKGSVSDALRRGLVEHKDAIIKNIAEREAIEAEGCGEFSEETEPYSKIGALVFPCTPDGTRLHNEPSAIADARQLESGAWQYRLEGFTQWRAHRELQERRE
jgi:hypothetical protein